MSGIDREYLEQRMKELGVGRSDQLTAIQIWLDKSFPGTVRALRIQRAVLTLTTPSASLASELRLNQHAIKRAGLELGIEITRLQIQIRG